MFRPEFDTPPLACADGQSFGAATTGEIDVIDSRLHVPQTMRASLGLDTDLPLGVVGTIEGLYTRATRAFFYSPLNVRETGGTDRHGRVMYGAVNGDGSVTPNRIVPQLSDIVAITNQSKDYSYDITAQLSKRSTIVDLDAAVSYGHARDVQSPRTVSALLVDNWRFARPVAGREDDRQLGTSDFDQPLRVRTAGTIRSPWRRLATELTISYVGGSGFPFTYVSGGSQGRGDLNADGAVGNDPIYIPTSALDPVEISFDGTSAEVAAQRVAFERFVDTAPCLREQRGRVMARNSCRSPWMSFTNAALRQSLPVGPTHSLALELQVFNVLNLLNAQWGRMQLPTGASFTTSSQVTLLSQVGAVSGAQAQPTYRFDPALSQFNSENIVSFYQVQFALRYNF
jgi:hypothetical protein